jgi:hypothetical protein
MLANSLPEKSDALVKQFEGFSKGDINDVEIIITYLQGGRTKYLAQLGPALERSTVTVMLKDPKDIQHPLFFKSPRGYPVLMVFTQEIRAKKALEKHPEYHHLAHIAFKNLIAGVGVEMGLVINPYEEILTFQFNPQQLNALKGCMLKDLPPSLAQEPMRLAQGMPGKFEGPENDLESKLMAFRHRQIDAPRFLEFLFNSQVFVLPQKDSFEQSGDKIVLAKDPHLFSITYPEYVALAVYTSKTSIKPTMDQYPDFRFAATVQTGGSLSNIASHSGLVINPYWDINLEWNPSQTEQIKGMIHRG